MTVATEFAEVPTLWFVSMSLVAGAAAVVAIAAVVLSWRDDRRRAQLLTALAKRAGASEVLDVVGHERDVDAAYHHVESTVDRLVDGIRIEEAAHLRLSRALGAIPQGVVVVDGQGEVTFRNDAAEEFASARHGDALVEAAVRELMSDAANAGVASSRTLELFGPPRRTVVISARPLVADGQALGAIAIVDDITDRRRLEAVRRDFVANISHELRTPIGALSLLADTLLDEDDPAVSRRLAGRMVHEATRLANTIEDLLVLSRIESEEAPEREAVPVHLVIAEAATRIQPAADQAGIDIIVAEPDPNIAVMGDRRQLVSAVYNLLDNAVKYSDEGSTVDVRATTDGRTVSLAVQDHGIGIPARDLERVFERFYRVDVARSRQTGGTGLGLSIVRHVVENHDGEVAVDSRLGEGSTFSLRLPLTAIGPVAVHPIDAMMERDAG